MHIKRNSISYGLSLCFFILLNSCGGSTTTADEALKTDTIIEAADHSMDSTLLAAYHQLNAHILSLDSTLLSIHMIELQDDTLLKALLNDSSTKLSLQLIDSILTDTMPKYLQEQKIKEEKEHKRIADSLNNIKKVDPHRPPSAQLNFYKYYLFKEAQPTSFKAEKSFPKKLLGLYYNEIDRNISIQITSSTLIYQTNKREVLFLLSDNQILKSEKNNYFFNYKIKIKTEEYWVSDLVILEDGKLIFRTVSPNDGTSKTPTEQEIDESLKNNELPSKKEIKEYLKNNETPIITTFIKQP